MKRIPVAVALVGLLLVGVAAALPEVEVRWYAARSIHAAPIELEDAPTIIPVFEIRTGWFCSPGPVEVAADGTESRTIDCEKFPDRVQYTLACGPDRLSDLQRLRFTTLGDPPPFQPTDTFAVGCVVE